MALKLFLLSSIFFSLIVIKHYIKKEKIPEYLSINANTDISRDLVYNFISEALFELTKTHGDNKQIMSDYLEYNRKKVKNYKEPDSWHTTCLYIGTNLSQLNTTIYKEFQEGIELDMKINTLVYIPGKILTSPVFYDNFNLIDNNFPHVTLMQGEYRAVDSNYVLKSLFEDNDYLAKLYHQGFIKDSKFTIDTELKNVEIFFNDKKQYDSCKKVYLIKFKKEVILKGVTTKNYFKNFK